MRKCPKCKGAGKVTYTQETLYHQTYGPGQIGVDSYRANCPECNGTGTAVSSWPCDSVFVLQGVSYPCMLTKGPKGNHSGNLHTFKHQGTSELKDKGYVIYWP
jgi:DnaJ-class molecular chaperone